MIKKLLFFKPINKINHFFVYCFVFLVFSACFYFVAPKFFNYLNKKDLLQETLNIKSGLDISKISKINYKIFPSPRLNIQNVNINFKNKSLKIPNGNIEIILNLNSLFNSKNFKYKKIFIINSSPEVDITEISNLLDIIDGNKKDILFKKNNFIFINKDKKLFELKNTNSKFNQSDNFRKLSLIGYLLNKKTSINYQKKQRHSLNIAIPEISLSVKSFFAKENKVTNGNSNIQIMDNFIRFDFIKENEFIIKNGFFRNKFIKADIEGFFHLDPIVNIDSNIDFKNLDLEVLNDFIIKKITNLNEDNLKILKKINGIFNINFNNHFSGEITTENGKILLKEFIISTPKYDLYLDGLFEKKGDFKVFKYKLLSKYNYKKKFLDLQFNGSINFSNKKIKFEKIIKNNNVLNKNDIEKYEKVFKNIVIKDNFKGIYNHKRVKLFFDSVTEDF